MFNLITIGDIVIDTHIQINDATLQCQLKDKPCQLCLDYASKIPIDDSFQSLGGNATNVAVATTQLGLKTSIISSIGDDSNGKLAMEELNKFNVNLDLIHIEPKNQTRYSVVLNFQKERTILSYHGKRKYIFPKKFPATKWIYYTGLSAGFELFQEKLLKYLQTHNTINLVFNPGSYQLKNKLGHITEVIKHTDILIMNVQEAELVLGTTLKKVKSISALIHGLINMGAREVVLTDAGNGAYMGNLDEVWHMKSFPVKVVAKTGAGDAFSAGYIAGRYHDCNGPQSLRWGIANSCGVITKVGAQNGLLGQKQITKMLAKYANIKPILITE